MLESNQLENIILEELAIKLRHHISQNIATDWEIYVSLDGCNSDLFSGLDEKTHLEIIIGISGQQAILCLAITKEMIYIYHNIWELPIDYKIPLDTRISLHDPGFEQKTLKKVKQIILRNPRVWGIHDTPTEPVCQ